MSWLQLRRRGFCVDPDASILIFVWLLLLFAVRIAGQFITSGPTKIFSQPLGRKLHDCRLEVRNINMQTLSRSRNNFIEEYVECMFMHRVDLLLQYDDPVDGPFTQ